MLNSYDSESGKNFIVKKQKPTSSRREIMRGWDTVSRCDFLCFIPPIIPLGHVDRPPFPASSTLSTSQPSFAARAHTGTHFLQGYSFSRRGKSSYSVAARLDHRETMAAIKSTGSLLFLAQAIAAVSLLLSGVKACDSWSPVICSASGFKCRCTTNCSG